MNQKIQVAIRIRPFMENELTKGYMNTKMKTDQISQKVLIYDQHSQQEKQFEFDHILDTKSTQLEIYNQCKLADMVQKVIEGFHATIFAYGSTGSGKTYTIEGKHEGNYYTNDDNKGIVCRAMEDIFSQIQNLKQQTKKDYQVKCSFLQIYNEKIYDLLNPCENGINQTGLKLRWSQREQFQVENLFVFEVKNSKDALKYFLQGIKNRITASHKLNLISSRSHSIFSIQILTFSADGAHETSAKLQLVDLAGSERISQTGTEGKIAKESIDINKSLFTLRQVISSLSEINQQQNTTGYQHVPYRESKLTSLLKQSFGGNSFCLMVACIVPCDLFQDENIQTLYYASKATYIKNKPIKNEDPNKQIIQEITRKNINLKNELEKANSHINFLTIALEKAELLNKQMQDSLNSKVSELNINQLSSQNNQIQNNYLNNSINKQNLNKEQLSFQLQQEKFRQQQMQQRMYEQEFLMKQTNLKMNQKEFDQMNSTYKKNNNELSLYENFSDRLIESITLVRQLLHSNKLLRQEADEYKNNMKETESDVLDLMKENQELRERISQLKKKSGSKKQKHNADKQENSSNSCQKNYDLNNSYIFDSATTNFARQTMYQQNIDSFEKTQNYQHMKIKQMHQQRILSNLNMNVSSQNANNNNFYYNNMGNTKKLNSINLQSRSQRSNSLTKSPLILQNIHNLHKQQENQYSYDLNCKGLRQISTSSSKTTQNCRKNSNQFI